MFMKDKKMIINEEMIEQAYIYAKKVFNEEYNGIF